MVETDLMFVLCWLPTSQLEQLSVEKTKLHKEKIDLENFMEAEQVSLRACGEEINQYAFSVS